MAVEAARTRETGRYGHLRIIIHGRQNPLPRGLFCACLDLRLEKEKVWPLSSCRIICDNCCRHINNVFAVFPKRKQFNKKADMERLLEKTKDII